MDHERNICEYCPYMQPLMIGQIDNSTGYSIKRNEEYIPAISYGHGSVYSDFWYGDGPYPNYYYGEYPYPYANYPYYPLQTSYQLHSKKDFQK